MTYRLTLFLLLTLFWTCNCSDETEELPTESSTTVEPTPAPVVIPVTGTYTLDRGEGGTGELQVQKIDDQTVRYVLDVVGGAPSYNQGFYANQTALIDGERFYITPTEDCRILVELTEAGAEITTESGHAADCGFGNRVLADGTYQRTSTRAPFLPGFDSPGEALYGSWQSLDDSRSSLLLESNGRYLEYYGSDVRLDGQFQYFDRCPDDCDGPGDQPCLLVYDGATSTCYRVVRVSDTSLRLAPMNGRGRTLRFERAK